MEVSTYQDYLQSLHSQFPAKVQDKGEENQLKILQLQSSREFYEMMEADTKKYSLYEEALKAAMADLVEEAEQETREVVVLVMGAGRGHLVKITLTAGQKTKRKLRVIAVEENVGALPSLQQLHEESCWGDSVKIISSISSFSQNTQDCADILVSDLVVSQIIPEHLAEASMLLKPGGVCIPSSYVTYLAPLQSTKLYSQVRRLEKEKEHGKHPLSVYESLYNVNLKVSSDQSIYLDLNKVFRIVTRWLPPRNCSGLISPARRTLATTTSNTLKSVSTWKRTPSSTVLPSTRRRRSTRRPRSPTCRRHSLLECCQ